MPAPISDKTIADGNAPDPEELDTRRSAEEIDVPLPEKVRHDFDATGNEPDDEEILHDWKDQERNTNDDEPDEDKEDLQQGDEGIDDPVPTQR